VSQTSAQCGLYDDPTFSGTITDDQAGTVSYYWDLPTGHTPAQDLVFATPGTQPVVTESIGPSAVNVSEAGRIVITSPREVVSNDADFTVTCPYAVPPDGLAFDTSSLPPDALVGDPYSAWVTVSNGKGPYTWSNLTGLPPGLTVTAYDGLLLISGTLTQAGQYNGSVLITDSSSPPLTTTGDIQIFVAAQRLSTIAPASKTCTVGQPCSFSVTAAGGDGTYTWLAMDQALPDGLSATSNGATFTVSGTPVTPGQYLLSGTVDGKFDREPWDQAGWSVTLTINSLAR
jgi:Putative Ig domain